MIIIRDLKNIKKYKNPVVAIGVFDGLHQGHRVLLKSSVSKAHAIGGKSIVVTFYPHPKNKESIYSLRHRLKLIEALGVDICLVVKFDKAFSRISAKDFVADFLIGRIGAQYLYVGENFRFGKNAEGDAEMLKAFAASGSFKVTVFKVLKERNAEISSTYIRALVTRGKLKEASRLLTRPVSVFGKVIRGTSRATYLGFPTANINPHHEIIPPSGIYAVRVLFNGSLKKGVCFIGAGSSRKERAGKKARIVEVHIFNFKQNIYGKYLEIQFIRKIRDEKRFSSSSILISRIEKDIISAKKILLH